MYKIIMLFSFAITALMLLTTTVFASDIKTSLSNANNIIDTTSSLVRSGNTERAKETYSSYNKIWLSTEDNVKKQSKQAYGDIEDKMGIVQFLFSQAPIQNDKLLEALKDLKQTNEGFVQGKYNNKNESSKNTNVQVKDLIVLLDQAKSQIKNEDNTEALKTMTEFSSNWIDIEGIILTKSQKIYNDTEKDMVAAKAYLSSKPVQADKALNVIDRMQAYLSQVSDSNSYSIIDVITIILREGLEALLVVIALLGFLNKSGHSDKKVWIFGGVWIGLAVSLVLAVLVKFLFSSGAFGSNNFLISGFTGIFAAIMLIYVSYWLHSKSSVNGWQNYIKSKSSKAIATGSLFSLGLLAFLAIFREGTETVLFYIGMASSVSLSVLLTGIALGSIILVLIAFLVLKVGLKIPMRPFFIVSSILVFYLGFKFTGMGINGLQLAGILPATSSDSLPTIAWLAVYPSWQGIIPQLILVVLAAAMAIKNYTNFKKIF